MTHSQERQKLIESKCPQKLDLTGKDVKAVIISMLKELKEIMFKESKEVQQ